VTENDREAFQDYLNRKAEAMPAAKAPPAAEQDPPPLTKISRRGMLKAVVGTAGVGAAAWATYSSVTGGSVSDQGAKHAGDRYTEAQRHNIDRQLVDQKADVGGRSLGKWIALLPTKMGGGCYALDLNTNRVLASVWYWNYGDFNPIAHHLCAFPSADPYRSFEFVNSTQGGKNSLIYGINTKIEKPGPGFNIYRVRYDGAQMEVIENVSETTGLGLGVHVTVNPKDAQSYFVTDGQKDIAACFDRETSRVISALKFRLGGEFKGASHVLDPGGQAQDLQDLPGCENREVRLSGHQRPEARMGNGADGGIVRGGGDGSGRLTAHAVRGGRHHLASDGTMGGDGRAALRRHLHSRRREQLRSGRIPGFQQGRSRPVSGETHR
jgi:hypothetical protein